MARKKKPSIRLYFIANVFAILCVTIAGAGVFTFLLNHFVSASVTIPSFLWILLFSVVLGGTLASYMSKGFLSPILRLRSAMRRVAEGDFSVRLEESEKIGEIRDTYVNFNLMARELGATETLQSDFISNVSHEFKTPINAIEGYATLLQDVNQDPEEQREYVEKILFNTRRLSELVGNILLLSKVDNQAIQAQRQAYRLDEQVRRAILALEHKWSAKEIDFDVEMEPITYLGNESLLLHVWTNLIDNAVKFSPQGGVVTIRLFGEDGRIACTVEDGGPGISQEAQAHIFDRFYQADSSHKEQGNGLGLALVKRILDTCGASVSVESAPGRGSAFTVHLPQGRQ